MEQKKEKGFKKANNNADMTVENTSASQIAPVRQDRIRNPYYLLF